MKVSILALNPCVDKNIYLSDNLIPGGHYRVEKVVENAAGKGLNQAVVFAHLGTKCDYFSFGSQEENDCTNTFINTQNIIYHKTTISHKIRENIKVIDKSGNGTEFNEAGGPVTQDELSQILSDTFAADCDILSLCGSIPQPVEKAVYKSCIERAKKKNCGTLTVLDADGEALRAGLLACPDVIKPNRRELAGLFGLEEAALANDADVIRKAREVFEKYGTTVLCTLDADGSICVCPEGIYRVGVAQVDMRGFSGAGDTYLAAYLNAKYSFLWQTEDCLSFAARAAAAKIALGGSFLPTREQIDAIPAVSVRKI